MKVIKLQLERTEITKEIIKGIEFTVAASPFFIPDRLEHGYDPNTGCYVVNLKYLDEEPIDSTTQSDGVVTLSFGIHTKRLMSVCFHVDRHDFDRITMIITDDIPRMLQSASRGRIPAQASLNYALADKALKDHARDFRVAAIS